MAFVSYAQNFEDVMLWRALRNVSRGFYIDVGAHVPRVDSVTLAFYERGWRGINIEPASAPYAALSAGRPRDINLKLCCGESAGQGTFYAIADTGLSTLDLGLVEAHARLGFCHTVEHVEIKPLGEICRTHVDGPIHFLKIDCEGAERAVLAGADFANYRPWIVLVEATVPMSEVPNFGDWEPILVEADYVFVWFDGLNRFYLASEHAGTLRAAFRTPPNVFDAFVKAPLEPIARSLEPAALVRALYRILRGRSPRRQQLENILASFDADGDLEKLIRSTLTKAKSRSSSRGQGTEAKK